MSTSQEMLANGRIYKFEAPSENSVYTHIYVYTYTHTVLLGLVDFAVG